MEAAIALNRFGLGAGPGDAAGVASDPRGWLAAQLTQPAVRPDGMPSAADLLRQAAATAEGDRPRLREAARRVYLNEVMWRERQAVATGQPLVERLVRFWSNRFAVSVRKPQLLGLAGAHEREAIRPHAVGRFENLLIGAVLHPAMLIYLDNVQSIGPNAPAGRRSGRGLNENLAREVLELHTLGVDGGYGQAEVRSLAAILTGWGVDPETGGVRFQSRRHEPGDKVLLGRRYAEAGGEEALQALRDLARHPATVRRLSAALARHFVADDPPEPLVGRLAARWQATDGDLRAVLLALVGSTEAWNARPGKLKTPADLVTSAHRALGAPVEDRIVLGSLRQLGQPPFAPPSPEGWSDRAEDWSGPEAVLARIEWAAGFARMARDGPPAADRVDVLLGPRQRPQLRAVLAAQASPVDGWALLLASPEFQRR